MGRDWSNKGCQLLRRPTLAMRDTVPLSECSHAEPRGVVLEYTGRHPEVLPTSVLLLRAAGVRCVDIVMDHDGFGIFALLSTWGVHPGRHTVRTKDEAFRRVAELNASVVLVQTFMPEVLPDWLSAWRGGHPQTLRQAEQGALRAAARVVLAGCHGAGYYCWRMHSALSRFDFYPSRAPGRMQAVPAYFGPGTPARRVPALHQASRRRLDFLVLGSIAFDGRKRDYDALTSLLGSLPTPTLARVRFVLFGSVAADERTRRGVARLRRVAGRALLMLSGPFERLEDAARNASFVVPLISERSTTPYASATADKMSSSVSMAMAFKKPLVVWSRLLDALRANGLDLGEQITHTDRAAGLIAAVVAAVALKDGSSAGYDAVAQRLHKAKTAHLCRAAHALRDLLCSEGVQGESSCNGMMIDMYGFHAVHYEVTDGTRIIVVGAPRQSALLAVSARRLALARAWARRRSTRTRSRASAAEVLFAATAATLLRRLGRHAAQGLGVVRHIQVLERHVRDAAGQRAAEAVVRQLELAQPPQAGQARRDGARELVRLEEDVAQRAHAPERGGEGAREPAARQLELLQAVRQVGGGQRQRAR